MTKKENEMLTQIMQTLNTFQVETVKAINDLREEVRENKKEIQRSREIEEAHWQENLRLWAENKQKWEENDKRWEENDKRWEENERRWEENRILWSEYKKNRIQDRNEIIGILNSYEITISKALEDPNVEKVIKY